MWARLIDWYVGEGGGALGLGGRLIFFRRGCKDGAADAAAGPTTGGHFAGVLGQCASFVGTVT